MSNKEIDWGNTFFSIKIYAILILLFLAGWFLPGIIQQHKHTSEIERLNYGGSVEEANATVKLSNKKIIELKNAVNNVLEENKSLYVFTNDTITTDSVTLYPNIDFDVFKPATPFGRPVIVRNNQVIDEIDTFLKNKDSLSSYYVSFKKNNHTFTIKRYQPLNDSLKFKLITYFKPTKAYNERPVIQNRKKYKYLYAKKIDSFETKNFKYRENHLNNLKKNYKYRPAILRPYYKYLYDDSFRFYFVCYNKNITKEVFQKNIDLLLKGSLSGLDCSGCKIKELQINTINSLK